MSTAELKLALMERLAFIHDAEVLQRLKRFFDRELGDEAFTADELAELEEIDRRRKAGLDTYLPVDEAMRLIREGRKG